MFTLPSGCWSHHRQQHWPGAVRDVGGQQSHRNLCVMTTEPRGVEPMTCGHYRQHLQEADVQSALPASGEDQAEPPHSSAVGIPSSCGGGGDEVHMRGNRATQSAQSRQRASPSPQTCSLCLLSSKRALTMGTPCPDFRDRGSCLLFLTFLRRNHPAPQ